MVVKQESRGERVNAMQDPDAPRVCRSTTASEPGLTSTYFLQSRPLGVGAPLSRAALVSPPILNDASTILSCSQFRVMLRESRATLPFSGTQFPGEWQRDSQPLTNWRNLGIGFPQRERTHYGPSGFAVQEQNAILSALFLAERVGAGIVYPDVNNPAPLFLPKTARFLTVLEPGMLY